MTECARARERITTWLSGEIDPDERRVLEEHFSACAACAADAGRLRQALDLLATGDVPDPGPVYWSSFVVRKRDWTSSSACSPAALDRGDRGGSGDPGGPLPSEAAS